MLTKRKGGLGIKDINNFNLALLGKWKWNLMQNQGELWARVLESKYGGWRGLMDANSTAHESIWWRDLKKVFLYSHQGQLINNGMKWRVRSGDKVKFWEDRWLGGEDSLAGKYPRLYRISSQQHQLVRQMGSHKDRGWEWNFTWRRSLFDSEIDLAVNFMREVDGKVIQQ
ncbi:hypothetical protein AAZX31_03G230200 [Glycine max]